MTGPNIRTTWLGLAVAMCVSAFSVHAADVKGSVLQEIKQAQQALNDSEKHISQQQQQLVQQYQALQQQVVKLRQQTAVSRRAEDESTLGLTQLTERLKSWQDQQHYQQNQLASFMRQHQINAPGQTLTDQLQASADYAARVARSLYPQWQTQDIILQNGELTPAQVLTMGPVSWFYLPAIAQGGLLQHEKHATDNAKVALLLPDSSALLQLQQQKQANLTFDPSLNKALMRSNQHESAVHHISKGGVWALPILAFALVALAIALHKAWQLWRLPAVPSSQLAQLNQTPLLGYSQELAQCARRFDVGQQRDDALFAVLQHSKLALEARLGAIGVTAAVAPLLGLLGTVSGMIETFNMMTLFGSGDPQVVSGGIAQALITTELGLVVAIPALVLHALLSRQVRRYYQQLESLALGLSQQLTTAAMPANNTEQAA